MLQINEPVRDWTPVPALTNNPYLEDMSVMAKLTIRNNRTICQSENCNRQFHAKGFCKYHYDLNRKMQLPQCSESGCTNIVLGVGLCSAHYQKMNYNRSLVLCSIDGCNEKMYEKGFCKKHYKQQYRHGAIANRTIFDKNEIIKKGDIAEIYLYDKNQKHIASAIVDADDIDRCSCKKWHLTNGYAVTSQGGNNGKFFLHRFVLNENTIEGPLIDHIDQNTLNNRKSNLRSCNASVNVQNSKMFVTNSTGYRGVSLHHTGKFSSRIKHNYTNIFLGLFETSFEAAIAYDKKAIELFGTNATTNKKLGVL